MIVDGDQYEQESYVLARIMRRLLNSGTVQAKVGEQIVFIGDVNYKLPAEEADLLANYLWRLHGPGAVEGKLTPDALYDQTASYGWQEPTRLTRVFVGDPQEPTTPQTWSQQRKQIRDRARAAVDSVPHTE